MTCPAVKTYTAQMGFVQKHRTGADTFYKDTTFETQVVEEALKY